MKAPKRKYPNISGREMDSVWRWRAKVVVDGKQLVGLFRATQEEASQDAQQLRLRNTPATATDRPSLATALAGVKADALRRRVKPEYYARNEDVHARYLLTFWEDTTPLDQLTRPEIEWMIGLALAATDEDGLPKRPRVATTLVQKDLRLLKLCFSWAGLDWPQPKNVPKKVRPQIEFFTIDEAQALVERVRSEDLRDRNGTPLRVIHRAFHADCIQFALETGIRAGEFMRLRVADVDLARNKIAVQSKVKSEPRFISLHPGLLKVVERLLEEARRGKRTTILPAGADYFPQKVCGRWGRRLNEPRLCGRVLRHTAATAILQRGATLPEAMEFLGHTHVTTTARYVHAATDSNARVAALLEGAFGRRAPGA